MCTVQFIGKENRESHLQEEDEKEGETRNDTRDTSAATIASSFALCIQSVTESVIVQETPLIDTAAERRESAHVSTPDDCSKSQQTSKEKEAHPEAAAVETRRYQHCLCLLRAHPPLLRQRPAERQAD